MDVRNTKPANLVTADSEQESEEDDLLENDDHLAFIYEDGQLLNEEDTHNDEKELNSATNSGHDLRKRKSSFKSEGEISEDDDNDYSATANENIEPANKVLKISEHCPSSACDRSPKTKLKINYEKVTTETLSRKKILQLNQDERLAHRAKKFGLDTNASSTPSVSKEKQRDVKVKQRTIGTNVDIDDHKQIELLKKRVERFGCVVSSKMSELETIDRVQKRKERFGVVSAVAEEAASGSTHETCKMSSNVRSRLGELKNKQLMERSHRY